MYFENRFVSAQDLAKSENEKTANSAEEDLIHLGDIIDVHVAGTYEYDWRGSLNSEGFLNGLGLEEPIYGLCRSEEETGAAVASAYTKTLKNPQVVVKIIDKSKRPETELLGAVKNPQRFQIRRTVFLNELLVLAGGLTENASGEVQILRPANLNCSQAVPSEKISAKIADTGSSNETKIIKIKVSDLLKGDREANPKIYSGDLITLMSAEPIYIIGAVQNPKQIQMRSQISVSRAIDSAGGISKGGRGEKITVFRRENGVTKIIEVDLPKINDHQAEDLILQAYDIVEVSQKGEGKRKYPPVLEEKEATGQNISSLPLRVIE